MVETLLIIKSIKQESPVINSLRPKGFTHLKLQRHFKSVTVVGIVKSNRQERRGKLTRWHHPTWLTGCKWASSIPVDSPPTPASCSWSDGRDGNYPASLMLTDPQVNVRAGSLSQRPCRWWWDSKHVLGLWPELRGARRTSDQTNADLSSETLYWCVHNDF